MRGRGRPLPQSLKMQDSAAPSAARNIGIALTMTQNATPAPWGFTQPDCRGAAALLFFMNDLARVVNQYLGQGQLSDEALADAQKAVDALLQRYIEIQAAPEAFNDEHIGLALETERQPDGTTGAQVALRMSPRLEGLIIEAQRQARATEH
ncbi:hypothetical protein LMG3431_05445 [Achromobacter pestifer]|uniref:Uncharacterized protein n=2 Tax=Achromobacter pestifer TaxID=1353889 RepID=A0A6S7A2Z3_9BURK|nr:hypothetical protein LMG3431_05445 [Achromobacter pestifer]